MDCDSPPNDYAFVQMWCGQFYREEVTVSQTIRHLDLSSNRYATTPSFWVIPLVMAQQSSRDNTSKVAADYQGPRPARTRFENALVLPGRRHVYLDTSSGSLLAHATGIEVEHYSLPDSTSAGMPMNVEHIAEMLLRCLEEASEGNRMAKRLEIIPGDAEWQQAARALREYALHRVKDYGQYLDEYARSFGDDEAERLHGWLSELARRLSS